MNAALREKLLKNNLTDEERVILKRIYSILVNRLVLPTGIFTNENERDTLILRHMEIEHVTTEAAIVFFNTIFERLPCQYDDVIRDEIDTLYPIDHMDLDEKMGINKKRFLNMSLFKYAIEISNGEITANDLRTLNTI